MNLEDLTCRPDSWGPCLAHKIVQASAILAQSFKTSRRGKLWKRRAKDLLGIFRIRIPVELDVEENAAGCVFPFLSKLNLNPAYLQRKSSGATNTHS